MAETQKIRKSGTDLVGTRDAVREADRECQKGKGKREGQQSLAARQVSSVASVVERSNIEY